MAETNYNSDESYNKTLFVGFNTEGMYLLSGTTLLQEFGMYIEYFGAFQTDDDALLDGDKKTYSTFYNISENVLKLVVEDRTVPIDIPIFIYDKGLTLDDDAIVAYQGDLYENNINIEKTTGWDVDWISMTKINSIINIRPFCQPNPLADKKRINVTDYCFVPLGTENIHIADSNYDDTANEQERIGEWKDGDTNEDKRIRPIQFGIMYMSDVNASNNAVKVGVIQDISTKHAI